MTASPFLTLNKGKKKQETFDIKDIEENLILLCKNLDSNFLGYDPAEVRMFLKEAQTSIKVFSNDKFIENCNGECFLKYLEDFNQENGTFETIIVQERLIAKFYLDFTNIILGTSRNNESLSKNFKEIVEEIDHYLRKKTLRILHELGYYYFLYIAHILWFLYSNKFFIINLDFVL